MSQKPNIGSLAGSWTYRSFLNNPNLATAFNDLEFGLGTIPHSGSSPRTVAPAGVVCSWIAVRQDDFGS